MYFDAVGGEISASAPCTVKGAVAECQVPVGVYDLAFRAAGQEFGHALLQNRGRSVHVAGCLALDRWQGEERVQLRLLDVAPTDGP